MHFLSFSILLIQVAVYALPTTSLSIYNRGDDSPKRPSDRQTEEVVIKGNNYTATPLPTLYQGTGELFRLEGGFQMPNGGRVPAILKRVLDPAENEPESSRTQVEINLMTRGSTALLLHSEWKKMETGYQFHIVVRDLRKVHPPFKPFPEWYKEREHISGTIALHTITKDIKSQLLWYVNNTHMIYDCYTMDNIFITEKLYNEQTEPTDNLWRANIIPVYWKPKYNSSDVFGIDDISNVSADQAAMKFAAYEEHIDDELESEFSVSKLRESLIALGGQLRVRDIRRVEFKNKKYMLLQRRRVHDVYTVYEVFKMGEGKRVERVADIMMVIDEREKDVAATQVLDVFPDNELLDVSSPGDDPFILVYKD